jgi:hypothetical protein
MKPTNDSLTWLVYSGWRNEWDKKKKETKNISTIKRSKYQTNITDYLV